jgi:hypothetical protein
MEKKFLISYDVPDAFHYRVRHNRVYKIKPVLRGISELIRQLFRGYLLENKASVVGYSVFIIPETAVAGFESLQVNLQDQLISTYEERIQQAKRTRDNERLRKLKKKLSLVKSDWKNIEPRIQIIGVSSLEG